MSKNLFILSPDYTQITKIDNFKLLNFSNNTQSDIIIGRKSGYFLPITPNYKTFNDEVVRTLIYDGNEYIAILTNKNNLATTTI